MKLEDLRKLLAECEAPKTTPENTASPDPLEVKRATLSVRNGELWEQVGVDVLLSDDPEPEALDYARKCSCGRMRQVHHEAGSRVHVILPCAMCLK